MTAIGTIHSAILHHERQWVILSGFLKDQGYKLRARYQPGWVPSWTKIKHPTPLTWQYEDGEHTMHGLMDATRVSDGARVMLKLARADNDNSEAISRFFAVEPRASNPLNHCLPLLAVLHPPEYPNRVILVSPYCLPWNLWPFVRVDEAVDFFTQVFEGLAFMHTNRVAHLDASDGNILMDAVHLYQEPFHPMRPRTRPYGDHDARYMERHQSNRPIKYYFIDFESSLHFEEATEPLVQRRLRQDRTVPEERAPDAGPCDPFAVDVYCVGNLILEHWLKAYENVEFIRKLAGDMTAANPTDRPTAEEVLRRFQAIRDSLSASELQQPLVQVPLYHSALLRGQQMLAEHKKRKKAAAASKRAARKKERAEQANLAWRRLGDVLSNLLPRRRMMLASGPPPASHQ